MDANLKDAWVDALRTGKFKRSFDRMFGSDGSVCALGMAYRLMGYSSVENFYDSRASLGLSDHVTRTIAGMNDGRFGHAIHSNDEIANYIEANVPVDEPQPQPDISVFTRMLEPRELVTGDD